MLLIAHDLETTNIKKGTPRLKYVTAFGDNSFKLSMPITGDNRLQTYCDILETHFLIPEHNGAMFIAYNSNNYDSYFVAQALLKSDKWIIQPYMTASKALRGLRVKSKDKVKIGGKWRILQFQFLDAISMLGMVGKKLSQFLDTFAPELPKMFITCPKCSADCTFEKCEKCGNEQIEFNHNIKKHVDYADRDSEGLYVAMKKAAQIIYELTGKPLKPTIGNVAIHFFMENVPKGILLKEPSLELKKILHGEVKRGGYCWCQKPYTGKVWKYDINQAYAAAMRDAPLPCGETTHTDKYLKGLSGIYQCTFSRSKPSLIPFYYKVEKDNVGRFTLGDKEVTTWLTSIEIEHLRGDGWNVNVIHGFVWSDTFNFKKVIDSLEKLRATDPGGPSGPLGLMVKAIGNNAYGKTLEQLNGIDLLIAQSCPDGYDVYDPFNDEHAMIFSKTKVPFRKKYHVPQIGVFVTAYVRSFVRQTALKAPNHFLYADTDCVVFSKPVQLPIHKIHYGDWKVEAEGVPYIIIGKKIYFGDDGSTKAKGLRTKELTKADYENWLKRQPSQTQTQRQNFLKFLSGKSMFKNQDRKGTNVENSKIYKLKGGRYVPE